MKKVIVSLAALATVSCAAITVSAASSIDFELNAAKSTATSKVVDVVLSSDDNSKVQCAMVDITFGASVDPSAVTVAPYWGEVTAENLSDDPQTWTFTADNGMVFENFANGSVKLFELTIPAGDMDAELVWNSITTENSAGIEEGDAELGTIAVVNAEDLGTFTDGEGDPAKAFKAAAEAEGAITWYVTDGTNVASKAVTEVTGGADVVVGLVATGANVANINYATVTID